MAFQKGKSGNPKGRPKMNAEEKSQTEEFKALLRTATVPALRSIIEIANSKCAKERLNACRYILDRAYGNNAIFLQEGMEDNSPLQIIITPYGKKDNEDEDWEESLDDDWEE